MRQSVVFVRNGIEQDRHVPNGQYLQNPDRGFDSRRRLSVFVGVFADSELADDRLTPTVDANPDGNA